MKKTYEAKADSLILTFPNTRLGKTVEIGTEKNPWPYTTEDVDEQRFLADHESVELAGEGGGVEATPEAQAKAQELNVDLSEVEGTGSGGRILVSDVEQAAKEREE